MYSKSLILWGVTRMIKNRLDACFASLKKKNRKALIPFITAGDPSLDITKEIALGMVARGADIIELGLPFSDPVADGPIIQASTERALKRGTTPEKVFELIKSIRAKTSIPIVLLTYYNPVFRIGLSKFIEKCMDSGIDGLVIPDLPYEERGPLLEVAKEHVAIISFLSPTTPRERIKKITRDPRGFIYCVSVTGVTGAREDVSTEARSMIQNFRNYTDLPLALGFGISTPEQAKETAEYADGVIIGSALVKKISSISNKEDIKEFLDYFSTFQLEQDFESLSSE